MSSANSETSRRASRRARDGTRATRDGTRARRARVRAARRRRGARACDARDATTSVRTTLRDRARMATSRVARATLDVRGYAADGSAHRVSARASFEYAYETREDDANATV